MELKRNFPYSQTERAEALETIGIADEIVA